MTAQPHEQPGSYVPEDPETALKYAIQRIKRDGRSQIIEGVIEQVSPTWDHEKAGARLQRQIDPVAEDLGCVIGAGNLDLPGSANWFVPDLAVVPEDLLEGAGALLPDQTLLVVEITSESNADTDRVVKRRRYAEYGAPLYLLVDRQERTCTLFSKPGPMGYEVKEGPRPFGAPVLLPAPFELELDTSRL
ncbi:Uma2 family endonuclease [Streptomyces sp. NPDC048172]|uniref:Uma2 family endonuclease n=1 Tax=Streptomyces sp. NPDC048172 TaxID=3365505 RepID=UPI0037220689